MPLTPEVQKLLDGGKLHSYDAEWIERLTPENQLAAAQKCMGTEVTAPTIRVDLGRKFQVGAGRKFRNKDIRSNEGKQNEGSKDD